MAGGCSLGDVLVAECTVDDCSGDAKAHGWCHTHYMRWRRTGTVHLKSTTERFWEKVDKNGPLPQTAWVPLDTNCWLWTATINSHGYGQFGISGVLTPPHRVVYEWEVGPIPKGMEIDHLCRVRSCVRPVHLEVVTHRTNTLRGDTVTAINARKTHCPEGHPYDAVNTYIRPSGSRECRMCVRRRNRKRRERL